MEISDKHINLTVVCDHLQLTAKTLEFRLRLRNGETLSDIQAGEDFKFS